MKFTGLSVLEDVEKMRRKVMMKQSEIPKDKTITAKEFDEKFDNGEDITEYLDFSNAIRLKDIKKLKTETKNYNF